MTEAKAARRAAREHPLTVELGGETFTFEPELPLDIILAYDTLVIGSERELEVWTVAHLLTETVCDTSCADGSKPLVERACAAEQAMRARLRKVRVGGRKLTEVDLTDFYTKVLAGYAVSEGESGTSAVSPATVGELSSGTPSGQGSTSTPSGDQAVAASGA